MAHGTTATAGAAYRYIGANRGDEAIAKGYKRRHFFPHRFYCLPKCGPDGFKLAARMCETKTPAACWEIVLYASSPTIDEFPHDLFFDDDLQWHQQHFGRVGQVAAVDLAVDGSSVYAMAHQSDLVQRISRRREHKTRVEKRFKGWHHMLLNSIANFALERGLTCIYSPRSRFAMRHTDQARTVQPELFERIYDRDLHALFPVRSAGEHWWVIDVSAIAAQILVAERGYEFIPWEKTICICHDIERGLGHVDTDPAFAAVANRTAPAALAEMLRIERDMRVRATYNVVGVLLEGVRPQIARDGHSIAFHSYDHSTADPVDEASSQLAKCRRIDYRIKGYRVPASRLTAELTEGNLCARNFEWIASSGDFRRLPAPAMPNRLVHVPILFDDFPLHTGRLNYTEWEHAALTHIERNEFVALSLHDCYASHWLPHYGGLLRKLMSLGRLRTVDDVVCDVILRHAQ